ncbi:efflux RND transporter periplasmic adaptor subunit [Paucihalobacter ruber]|uniref:Efflux RND transporter periplasmic adaptor subunit n=1 Tax=Paucihalobacter ruber TaxID=2567861 RepID=A0A506PGG6_9FLAO|nr:efflux RND transporter periplasmic adaptor subunit [Paucihalobacter ruber]TPV31430.1 efflux RND transporter periplasmic adaptor subunit [Paucihalobacter ruber]
MRLILFSGAFLCLLACNNNTQSVTTPPPKVQVVSLQQQEVTLEKDFVGQVYGYNDIPIRTRVEGFLEKIAFQEGSFVKRGDLLYVVDPDPLLEAVNAAKSELARSQVNNERAISDLNRIEPLSEINAVSKKDLDAALAEKKGTDAIVNASEANLNLAQIRLGYASIKAPVDGIIGKTMARTGEFVGRAPNPVILNTISTVDSLRVEFFVTESDYLAWANHSKSNKSDTKSTPLQLILSDGSLFPYKGKVNFINREVNNVTGTILIQSVFPNPDRLVRPGQFARVRAAVETLPNALLVPQRCVNEVQGNYFVLRVKESGEVEQVGVQLGQSYRDYFIVLDGLSPNDKVIYEGLQRAKTGFQVEAEVVEFQSQFKAE